jgi:hypothetical protein
MLLAVLDILIFGLLGSIVWDSQWLTHLKNLKVAVGTDKNRKMAFSAWKGALGGFLSFWACFLLFVFGRHLYLEISETDSLVKGFFLFSTQFFGIILELSAMISLLMLLCGVFLVPSTAGNARKRKVLAIGSVFYFGVAVASFWSLKLEGFTPILGSIGPGGVFILELFIFLTQSLLFRRYYLEFFGQ